MKDKLKIIIVGFILINTCVYSQNTDSILINSLYEKCDLSFQNHEYEKCRFLAEQILEIDNSNCNAYMIIGKVYANIPKDYLAEIMDGKIEYNMIYCLAVDMFIKAKEADTLCIENADKEIALYSKYFPSSHFGYNDDMLGEKYKINGWINRTTTIRFRD